MSDKSPTTSKSLTRPEAQLVADYLRRHGRDLPNGWVGVWKLTPEEVGKRYGITPSTITREARREETRVT